MAINPQYIISADNGTFPQIDLRDTNGILCIEPSSHTIAPTGEGLVIEAFIIYAKNEPTTIMSEVQLLESLLKLAADVHTKKTPRERVRLTVRNKDEDQSRSSTIIGGSITPIPNGVVTVDMKRDAARFAVTIERRILWEGLANWKQKNNLDIHGGSFVLPKKLTSGRQDVRVKVLKVETVGTSRLRRFWIGIKGAIGSISGFNPEIRVRDNGTCRINNNVAGWNDDATDYGFADGEGLQVHWSYGGSGANWDTSWAQVYSIPLASWNADTGTVANRRAYYGDYHLICRYRTDSDQGETYGIRAGYGWGNFPDATQLERIYFEPTDSQFRYMNLGVVSIGTNGLNTEMEERISLRDFRVSIHATVIDNATGYISSTETENLSFLYLDNMWLVPAEHYLHAELPQNIGGDKAHLRAEVYTDDTGAQYGVIIHRKDEDSLGQPHPNARRIYYAIEELDGTSWAIPNYEDSELVFVGDSNGGTLSLNAKVNIGVQTVQRAFNT
jgi:hypothetical protein